MTHSLTESSKPSKLNKTAKSALAAFLLLTLALATAEVAPASAVNLPLATKVLAKLAVKGRAPKTGYARSLFSDGWGNIYGCDTRNYILKRDLTSITWRSGENCVVATGVLKDPYTGLRIDFVRGVRTSLAVQIDHVVAVSDAWQKGAQQLNAQSRYSFYNDPLNLLAVDGPTNGAKGDGDAATWLPPNKGYRCAYVARQVAVKSKYRLWVTAAEKDAIARVLTTCPKQVIPAG